MHSENTDFYRTHHTFASSQQDFISKFSATIRFYATFHIAFFSFTFLQIITLILFFSFLMQSSWAAIALASLVLTGFSYSVLHFYFQAKKPQQLLEISDQIDKKLQEEGKQGESLCASLLQLCEQLPPIQEQLYPFFRDFANLHRLAVKLSIWLHWKDILKMQELLIFCCINHSVAIIKESPLCTKAHRHLAIAYTSLAKIYQDPSLSDKDKKIPWIPKEYKSAKMQRKLHSACDRAIEELKIIDAYSGKDIETHKMLASLYHLKKDKEKEIEEFETLVAIDPSNHHLLHNLGILYFEKGMNFKGMKIYETLKTFDLSLAEDLLSYYDSMEVQELSIESFTEGL